MNILETEDLTKSFGAMTAVTDVNLAVEPKTLHAVIGPNGAGKTTLLRLISGELPVSSGRVIFQGEDLTALPAHAVARKGIGFSFQKTNLFPRMTTYDNIWLAAFSMRRTVGKLFSRAGRLKKTGSITDGIMERVGLTDSRDRQASELPHHEQRLLEIAIALALNPSLLLLDEPTSGMAHEEIPRMIDLITDLKKEYTVIMIEHNMDIVMSISDSISVMHFGELIARGTPHEIKNNEKVKQAYLGN